MNFFTCLNEIRFSLWEMVFYIAISCTLFYFYLICFSTSYSKRNLATSAQTAATMDAKPGVDIELLKCRVDEQIRAQQLYTNPHLNIERMAQLLDLPVRQLSQLVRTGFNKNYFEFINHYRLMAAKERLISDEWEKSSVQDIYESVGFSSRSTFFTLFKKREGITPAEYRVKHRIRQS